MKCVIVHIEYWWIINEKSKNEKGTTKDEICRFNVQKESKAEKEMKKEKKIKRSLIPDPIRGLLDIQAVGRNVDTYDGGETYEAAEDITPIKVTEFYDPNFSPEIDVGLLSIYDGPRYGGKTLKELKEMCKERDLPVSGTKKTLIDRLDEQNKQLKEEIKLKAEINKNKEIKKAQAEKVIVDNTVAGKLRMIKTRLKKAQTLRLQKLDTLISAQQAFDKVEQNVNELKVTIKSLESLF